MVATLLLIILFLTLWIIKLYRAISTLKSKSVLAQEMHRQEFQDMIARINHEGQVPIASTALGLTGLISTAILRCLNSLKDLRANQDYNTSSVSEELSGIRSLEVHLLYVKISDLLLAIREVLDEYDHNQNKK